MDSEWESGSLDETIVRLDVPGTEIDWSRLLEALARSTEFDDMMVPIYGSGVLVTDYKPLPDDDVDSLTFGADLYGLRSLLTAIVRGDRFLDGMGDTAYWNGDIDLILDAIGTRVGVPYPLHASTGGTPRRVVPCPNCGDTKDVQIVVFGMPAAPSIDDDDSRVVFAGCVVDDEAFDWSCPACQLGYYYPQAGLGADAWEFL